MAIKRNQVRQDSASVPAKLTAEEERLIALSEKNTKFDRNELVLPRLKILQPLNPEVQEGGNQYVEGAKPGMFFNTSSGKLTPGQEGMIFCVIGHTKQVLEWVPREAGGGLVKNWGSDDGWKALCDPIERDKFNPITRDGHTIDKQRSFLIFDINPVTGEVDPSWFNLKGTGNRVANHIASLLTQSRITLGNGKSIVPPYYYLTYKMTLDKLTNVKGTWWSPRVVKNANKTGAHIQTTAMPNGQEIFNNAVTMQEHFMEGDVQQVDYGEQGDEDNNSDLGGDRVTF